MDVRYYEGHGRTEREEGEKMEVCISSAMYQVGIYIILSICTYNTYNFNLTERLS